MGGLDRAPVHPRIRVRAAARTVGTGFDGRIETMQFDLRSPRHANPPVSRRHEQSARHPTHAPGTPELIEFRRCARRSMAARSSTGKDATAPSMASPPRSPVSEIRRGAAGTGGRPMPRGVLGGPTTSSLGSIGNGCPVPSAGRGGRRPELERRSSRSCRRDPGSLVGRRNSHWYSPS